MPRIAIARFSHEGNSFSPVATDLAAFQGNEWAIGAAGATTAYRGTATEIGGALEFLAERPHWEAAFLRLAGATPAGPVPRADYEAIAGEILDGLRDGGPWDLVYLSLHGAMVAEGLELADYELVRRVREAIGPATPLGVNFDLHANLDPRIAGLATFAAGYKTHPHVDQRETALRMLQVLEGVLEGRLQPVGHIAKLDAILPSINMRTLEGPMAELEAFARGLEFDPRILDVSPFGGFSYGDSPAAGAAAMVYADADAALARRAAEALLAEMRARRDRFWMRLPSAAEGIARALAAGGRPVAVVDAGDNPGSGGIGDTPEMLRALLAAQPLVPVAFAFFHDPALVERAAAAGVGAPIEGTLGGRLTDAFGPPVPFSGRVLRLTDGRFANRGPMMRGLAVSLGRTALIGIGNVQVIVTSLCRSPNDPGFLDIHGIDPSAIALLCVKAKNHFRAAFRDLMAEMIDIDAPGPAALDIAAFPFRRAPRGLHPLTSATSL
jgi:microcystin degradation protein MlrC